MTKKTALLLIAVLIFIAIPKSVFASHPPDGKNYGDHPRTFLDYICEKKVVYKNSGTRADGKRYQVVELQLVGNDNSSIHYNETGSALPINSRSCNTTLNASIWGNDWRFNPSQVLLGGDQPIDISLGGVASSGEAANFCIQRLSAVALYMRNMYGVQCSTSGAQIGEINDGGAVSINGKKLYCAALPGDNYISGFSGYPSCPSYGSSTAQANFDTVKGGAPFDYEGVPLVGYLSKNTVVSQQATTIDPAVSKYISETSQPSMYAGGNHFGLGKSGDSLNSFPVRAWAINTENGWGGFGGTRDGYVPRSDSDFDSKATAELFRGYCGGNYVQCKSLKSSVRFTLIYNKKTITEAEYKNVAEIAESGSSYPPLVSGVRVVEPGRVYKLYPSVKNEGAAKTPEKQRMFVSARWTDKYITRLAEGPISPPSYKDKVIFWDAYEYYHWGDYIGNNCDSGGFWTFRCWEWGFKNLGSGSTVNASLTFKVKEDTPDGTIICFEPFVRRQSASVGVNVGTARCFKVSVPTKPILRVTGGDTHAGAVLSMLPSGDTDSTCTPPSLPAQIKTHGGDGTSSGEYAVSAAGAIDGFRSEGGSSPSTTDLTFNNQISRGNYKVICRPNLANVVMNSSHEPKSGAVSINSLGSKAYVFSSGNKTIAGGTVAKDKRLTVVVNGDITINGNIQYAPNYGNRSGIPALAIIATGNIHIAPNVTQLEGLYVSNRKIITCSDGASGAYSTLPSFSPKIKTGGAASSCNKSLKINGVVVANEVYFRRTSGDIGKEAAETISFLPELYLAPPPLTGNLLNLIRENQLDLPPVF